MQRTIILCPLYHDEASFNIFADAVERQVSSMDGHHFSFLIVNDGTGKINIKSNLPFLIVNLHRNLGHQKAIATGLAYANEHLDFDNIIIMDGDGEDRPDEIPALINASANSSTIVVARRSKRQEGRGFRLFYVFYKFFFRILTGKKITFGNFMLLPKYAVTKIVHHSEIWSHLAGAIVKSQLPFIAVPTVRGKRYQGNSKMNFTSLFLHGLGAIGVFIEVTATRLLIFSMIMILLSLAAIGVIFFIRIFTERAIPGWATSAVSSMLIVLLQSFLLSLFTIFLYLSAQSQKKFIPAHHYSEYVQSVENFA